MRTIRRNMLKRQRRVFLAVFSLILVATLSYIVVINPLFSYAESQYMTATIVDDDGTVDFSPGIDGAVADMSFSNDGDWSEKTNVYDLKITLNNLPIGEKKLETIVSAGMVWIDDGASDENLRAQLDSEKYENGIQKTELAHEPILNYTFPNSGSRTYYLAEGVTAVTFNLKIGVDTQVDLDNRRIYPLVLLRAEILAVALVMHRSIFTLRAGKLINHMRTIIDSFIIR